MREQCCKRKGQNVSTLELDTEQVQSWGQFINLINSKKCLVSFAKNWFSCRDLVTLHWNDQINMLVSHLGEMTKITPVVVSMKWCNSRVFHILVKCRIWLKCRNLRVFPGTKWLLTTNVLEELAAQTSFQIRSGDRFTHIMYWSQFSSLAMWLKVCKSILSGMSPF